MFIGVPIPLDLDELACDRYGCDASARLLVPCAALCTDCAAEFGVGVRDAYEIDFGELVGGEQWRLARANDYVERVCAAGPRVRDEHVEATLAALASRTIGALDQ